MKRQKQLADQIPDALDFADAWPRVAQRLADDDEAGSPGGVLAGLALVQRRRDQAAGLNTAGFISGYRGSPLGGLDQALSKAKKHLEAHHVIHWLRGGLTDLDNLVLLCHRHHWMVHEGNWQIVRGDLGGIRC